MVDHHTHRDIPHDVTRQDGVFEKGIRQVYKDSGSFGERSAFSFSRQPRRYRSGLYDVESIRGLPKGVYRCMFYAPTKEAVQQGGGESYRERPSDVYATRLSKR